MFVKGGPSEQLLLEGSEQSLFIVVAIGNRGLMAVGSVSVERPITRPTGTLTHPHILHILTYNCTRRACNDIHIQCGCC